MTEDQLQAQCFQWAWNNLPETRRLLFHVPNELERLPGEAQGSHIRRIMALRAKGVVKGVHDNIFIWKGQVYTIELKVGSNDLSPEQKVWGSTVELHGAKTFKAKTLEQFQSIIKTIIS